MSDLKQQLESVKHAVKENLPTEAYNTIIDEVKNLKKSCIEGNVVKDGDKAPDFTLPNHLGQNINLSTMLKKGPLVVSFYRGGW